MARFATREHRDFTEGAWFDERGEIREDNEAPPEGEAFFKIARDQNRLYLAALDKQRRAKKRKIKRGTLTSQENMDATCEAMAEGILVDWKGTVENEDGDNLEPSKENRYALLRYNPELREFIAECAASFDKFLQAEKEDRVGKLSSGSTGGE